MQDANYVNNRKSNASNDIKHMWQRLQSDEMAIHTQDLLLFFIMCVCKENSYHSFVIVFINSKGTYETQYERQYPQFV